MKKNILKISIFIGVFFLAGCAGVEKGNDMKEKQTEKSNEKNEMMVKKEAPNEMGSEMEKKYTDISPKDAKKLIDENSSLVVLDVSPLYAQGHLPGAINHYVGDGSLDKAIPTLDKEATYLVYCHNDRASILGAQKLIDAGFKNVYRLEGNYSAWVEAGYPIEK